MPIVHYTLYRVCLYSSLIITKHSSSCLFFTKIIILIHSNTLISAIHYTSLLCHKSFKDLITHSACVWVRARNTLSLCHLLYMRTMTQNKIQLGLVKCIMCNKYCLITSRVCPVIAIPSLFIN